MNFILPEWPAPTRVNAAITTRIGGVSRGQYSSLNLGAHVGDDPTAVTQNRALLRSALKLPGEPLWLQQVHGCDVVEREQASAGCEADAICATTPGQVCAVLTADCLPLLLCDRLGTRVCAVHAGWRGLAGGVIEAALRRFDCPGDEVLAWLGPAIGPERFEVGEEVRKRFVEQNSEAEAAFRAVSGNHWLADIYLLARQRLAQCSVGFVGGGQYCTVSDPKRFFSYRRDGMTGRMASLIWIDPD